jgi:hypothetical protein
MMVRNYIIEKLLRKVINYENEYQNRTIIMITKSGNNNHNKNGNIKI